MIDLKDYIIKKESNKSSRKLYKMICNSCHKDRGYQRLSRKGLDLCKSCASSVTHKNKVTSVDTRLKMSKNNYTKKGIPHPLKGVPVSEKTKIKLSITTSNQNKSYKPNFLYKNIKMRSSWEVSYAKYLDSQEIRWEYEPKFKLSNNRVYISDFKLEDGTIVEIKGYMREDAKDKWELFCKDYPNLKKSILFKKDLKSIGVL